MVQVNPLSISQEFSVFWFRRDLRLQDNTGLTAALRGPFPVLPVFLFDPFILDKLQDKADKRVEFIHNTLMKLKLDLEDMGSSLWVTHLPPLDAMKLLAGTGKLKEVYTNHDYEPYAIQRDREVGQFLAGQGISFHTYKDQLIFEKNEILKQDGTPFSIFTPYSRRWLAAFETMKFNTAESKNENLIRLAPKEMPDLDQLGFTAGGTRFPSPEIPHEILANYHKTRDLPDLPTSRLGMHLRFGTLSIRELAREAYAANKVFLNELIWREFFMSILWHFPQVTTQSFRPEYDRIIWVNDPADFKRWQEGMTGFPLVDAGMRELASTGFMHNRVRMVTASFLAKDLLIDWRWGEAWFAEKLLDFELSSNNGNWQWAAGCGCDAAPYFRIFNPDTQLKKFDPDLNYVRRWLPEFGTPAYPKPMIDHAFARERCLKTYKNALKP